MMNLYETCPMNDKFLDRNVEKEKWIEERMLTITTEQIFEVFSEEIDEFRYALAQEDWENNYGETK